MSQSEEKKTKFNYKDSGVDVDTGDALVDWLQVDHGLKNPHQNRILSGIGGFASLFRADFPEMKKPCLVTCTDGVGTKVKLASYFNDFSGIGQDLVAMCVNDLICTGGKPLLFLDYYAVGKLDLEVAKSFLQSVRKACHDSDCALVGGETAEMPGVYKNGDFDCAGFAVGIVDEEKTLGAHRVRVGDRVLGISSSGCHSNGYSLLREIFKMDLDQYRKELLEPTALYVKVSQELIHQCQINAFAHITGGGIENIPRVLSENTRVRITPWEFSSFFKEVQSRTQMSYREMVNTLNCGIGFVVICPESDQEKVRGIVTKHQFKIYDLGFVESSQGAPSVSMVEME